MHFYLLASDVWVPSYAQFMSVFAKTVAERTKPGQRQDVEEKCEALSPHLVSYTHTLHFQPTPSMPTRVQKALLASSSPTPTTLLSLPTSSSQRLLTSSFRAILALPSPPPRILILLSLSPN